MKNLILLTLIAGIAFPAASQGTYDQKVFDATEITYFGFDFSHFKLADIKQYGKTKDDKSKIMAGWSTWLNKYVNENLLSKKFEKKITISRMVTDAINENVVPGDNLVEERTYLDKSQIPTWIKAYEFTETEGIGMVVIVDCLFRDKNRTALYFVYFDIATREVLASVPFETKEADGKGLIAFWGKGMEFTVKFYLADDYRKALKKSK